jgi:hypothetical protein
MPTCRSIPRSTKQDVEKAAVLTRPTLTRLAPSCVLASLNTCDVRNGVRLGILLAAALLNKLFEHPASRFKLVALRKRRHPA